LEGYLWDKPRAKEAVLSAAKTARDNGRKVALSLSDSFCVDRHRGEFQSLLEEYVDVLFANENEICGLFESSFEQAVHAVRDKCELAALTRADKGSVVVAESGVSEIPAAPVSRVIDTTGAGDLYAAGFLFGLSRGRTPADCGQLGSLCAAEIIAHFGARPETSLKDWIARH
jgi:sugar/nucleoside kinase (ribokinase family)